MINRPKTVKSALLNYAKIHQIQPHSFIFPDSIVVFKKSLPKFNFIAEGHLSIKFLPQSRLLPQLSCLYFTNPDHLYLAKLALSIHTQKFLKATSPQQAFQALCLRFTPHKDFIETFEKLLR
jgi:hypothetical protein